MTREMSNLSMLHTFLRDDGNDTGWNISQHPERSWIYYHHLDQWSEKKRKNSANHAFLYKLRNDDIYVDNQ